MTWLQAYGYSDCVFCDIIAHQPWEPANFVYEDDEVSVFHNILGWIPVMLIAVPRGRIIDGVGGRDRHYHQLDLWRNMGRLGAIAISMGRAFCRFDGHASFRLVCNVGSLALQTQSHAHLHILGSAFQPAYPDLRSNGSLLYGDDDLEAFEGALQSRHGSRDIKAVMIVPKAAQSQDEFFASMDRYGPKIVEIALRELGESFRLLAEVGPHAPIPDDGAHLYILGGSFLGHYV
jgi:diadenosine tetraphosphate (Ap4A) HIT family hydrolase